jgi:hypothetical protein
MYSFVRLHTVQIYLSEKYEFLEKIGINYDSITTK